MTDAERKAFDAMLAALSSIYEVDELGDGIATVNIDYVAVEAAFAAVDVVNNEVREALNTPFTPSAT